MKASNQQKKKWYKTTLVKLGCMVPMGIFLALLALGFLIDYNQTPEERAAYQNKKRQERITEAREDSIQEAYEASPQYQIDQEQKKLETAQRKAQEELEAARKEAQEENKKQILEQLYSIQEDCSYTRLDGSYFEVNWFIKQRLNDPDSFDHVKTISVPGINEIIVKVTFRANNAYGGKVLDTWVVKIYPSCKIKLIST
jgi:hypothetical protein